MKKIVSIVYLLFAMTMVNAQQKESGIKSSYFSVSLNNAAGYLWNYHFKGALKPVAIKAPLFEIDNKVIDSKLLNIKPHKAILLKNGVTEQTFEGAIIADTSLHLLITFRYMAGSPVLRYRYSLQSSGSHVFTKQKGADNFTYSTVAIAADYQTKEIRLSSFDEKLHANRLTETIIDKRYFDNEASVMGPIIVAGNKRQTILMAYEHGSQYPTKFLEFKLQKNNSISLSAVKGNYLNQQVLSINEPYETIWFEIAGINGNEDAMAAHYRNFVLKYLSENEESRKPYIFYNTWGRQERDKWAGGKYLSNINLAATLKEIEVAHKMGIEVYVIDAGWFLKTGDWEVNLKLFPDTLRQVKELLQKYDMKLGLWFNCSAALSSEMLEKNKSNKITWNGKQDGPWEIWETEASVGLSLVSPYWEDFANKLIRLSKDLGVTYFKLDAINQHGSNAAGQFNGTEANTAEERADSYAFQLPVYLSKMADKVCKAAPQSIFDFDITEPGRSMGLQFLSSGKYFIINNGPYFHNFDLAETWKSPLASGNANVFVNPGPARGWFARSILSYDKWIPSVLFLTHYQPDEPHNSQLINIASLILGQNGIWGEILKTAPEGIEMFSSLLNKYKQVRNDITISNPVIIGEPGSSPEIHEKVNPSTGKGAVVIFANAAGKYTYITQNKVSISNWHNEGVTVNYDKKGRAVISTTFEDSSAKIIFFGVD